MFTRGCILIVPELWNELKLIANNMGLQRAELVRRILHDYLDTHDKRGKPTTNKTA